MKFTAVIAAGLAGLIATHAAAQTITFYEENNCRKPVFRYTGTQPVAESCKSGRSKCASKNDVARSMRIVQPAWMGLRLVVYDDPNGGSNDDVSETLVKGNPKPGAPDHNICVRSFELDSWNPVESTSWNRKNGLDGKVSYIRKQHLGRQNEILR